MKKRLWLIFGLGAATMAVVAAVVTKISEYPQVTVPGTNDLFVLASGSTNKNIKYSDLKTAIGGGGNTVWTNVAGIVSVVGLPTNEVDIVRTNIANADHSLYVEGDANGTGQPSVMLVRMYDGDAPFTGISSATAIFKNSTTGSGTLTNSGNIFNYGSAGQYGIIGDVNSGTYSLNDQAAGVYGIGDGGNAISIGVLGLSADQIDGQNLIAVAGSAFGTLAYSNLVGGYFQISTNTSQSVPSLQSAAIMLNNTTTGKPLVAGINNGTPFIGISITNSVATVQGGIVTALSTPAAGVTGSGTTNRITKWTSSSAIGNASPTDDGNLWDFGLSLSQIRFPDGSLISPAIAFRVQTNIGLARIADSTLSLVAGGITGDFGSGANGSYNGFTVGHLRATNDITLIAGALSGRVLISDQFGVGNWGTNVDILNVTNIYVQNSIFIKGKAAAVVSVNGTNTPILNLKDTATLSWVITMGTNGEATATVSGGGSVYVDGVNVSNPNFKSGSDIIWTIGGTLTNVIPSLAIQTFNTLTYSGTNVTLDASLGNSQAANYKLSLTNATWMTVPTSMPTSPKMFYIWYQQPSTGTVTVGFTNNFHFPGGVVPTVDTNANAQTLLVFMTGPFTNNALNFMGIVPQIQ